MQNIPKFVPVALRNLPGGVTRGQSQARMESYRPGVVVAPERALAGILDLPDLDRELRCLCGRRLLQRTVLPRDSAFLAREFPSGAHTEQKPPNH